ncbi:unnamed protein product, partial [Vitis vinifera]
MATPSPPPPSSSPPNRPKKAQPLPWSHQETTHLIQAYQEKWYSLKRGQLKASQWEEVAVTVAARCNYDEPSKSATQCRHKIEKLRKRYRAEKQRIVIGAAASSSWPYFHLMDSLERGPLPISAQPMSVLKYEKAYPYSHNCKPNDDNVGNDDYSNSSNDEDSGALKTSRRRRGRWWWREGRAWFGSRAKHLTSFSGRFCFQEELIFIVIISFLFFIRML